MHALETGTQLHIDVFKDSSAARSTQILDQLSKEGLEWPGNKFQGGAFRRGWYYLAASMNDSSYEIHELGYVIKAMASILKDTEQYMIKAVVKDKTIRERAGQWLSTLGRTVCQDYSYVDII